jgi:hypothetical protein
LSGTRLAAAAVALLAACAPVEWHREGAGAADRERDLAECRAHARLQSRHEAPLHGFPPPHPVGVDSRGRIVTGHAARYDTERALLEHDLTRRCMRERGYELVPVGKRRADDEVRR